VLRTPFGDAVGTALAICLAQYRKITAATPPVTLRSQTRRNAMTMTTCSVEEAAPSRERLLFWASLAGCVVLAITCAILLFSVRSAVAERDYAYARADAAETKAAQEAMRAATLDVKLNAKQVQLQQATDQVAQVRAEMLAKEQISMQAQRADSTPAPSERERPPRGLVPVEISFNHFVSGNERVGVFTNVSTKDLTIVVELTTATNSRQARFTLDIPARGHKEIGPREGWQFARGDNITTISGGYETLRLNVQ
jgi:hypothetical protein